MKFILRSFYQLLTTSSSTVGLSFTSIYTKIYMTNFTRFTIISSICMNNMNCFCISTIKSVRISWFNEWSSRIETYIQKLFALIILKNYVKFIPTNQLFVPLENLNNLILVHKHVHPMNVQHMWFYPLAIQNCAKMQNFLQDI